MSFCRIIFVAFGLLYGIAAEAQPEHPFTPDSTTAGLWSFDSRSIERLENVVELDTLSATWFASTIALQDGNILLTGSPSAEGENAGLALMKMTPAGDIIWIRKYFFGNEIEAAGVTAVQATDGSIWITSSTKMGEAALYAMFVFHASQDGDSLLARFFTSPSENGSLFGSCLTIDSDGAIVVGCTNVPDIILGEATSISIVKLTADGETLWQSTYPYEGNEFTEVGADEILETSDGGYLCLGNSASFPPIFGYRTSYALWVDGQGNRVHDRRFEFRGQPTYINDAVRIGDKILMAGVVQEAWDGQFDPSDERLWLCTIDEAGEITNLNMLGEETFDSAVISEAFSIARPLNGGDIAVASTHFFPDSLHRPAQTAIVTLSPLGEFKSSVMFDTRLEDRVSAIVPLPDGRFLIQGRKIDDNDERYRYVATTNSTIYAGADRSPFDNYFQLDSSAIQVDGHFDEGLRLPQSSFKPVIAEDAPSLRPAMFRLEGWVNPGGNTPSISTVISKSYLQDQSSFSITFDRDQEELGFYLTTTEGDFSVRCNAVRDDGQWHYFAATATGQYLCIRWDDSDSTVSNFSGEILYDKGPLLLGTNLNLIDSTSVFRGLVDEIKLTSYLENPYNSIGTELGSVAPLKFEILSSYPNPFNSSTTISYTLPTSGRYTLSVTDIAGREVARLSDGWKEAGSYREVWDGAGIASGTYQLRLSNGRDVSYSKIQLLK